MVMTGFAVNVPEVGKKLCGPAKLVADDAAPVVRDVVLFTGINHIPFVIVVNPDVTVDVAPQDVFVVESRTPM